MAEKKKKSKRPKGADMKKARAQSIKGRLAVILKGPSRRKKKVGGGTTQPTKKAKAKAAKPMLETVRDRIQQEKILTEGKGIRMAAIEAKKKAKAAAAKKKVAAKSGTLKSRAKAGRARKRARKR